MGWKRSRNPPFLFRMSGQHKITDGKQGGKIWVFGRDGDWGIGGEKRE